MRSGSTQTRFYKLAVSYVEILVGRIVLNIVSFRNGYSYRGDRGLSSKSVEKLSTIFASYLWSCNYSFILGFAFLLLSISFSDIHIALIC